MSDNLFGSTADMDKFDVLPVSEIQAYSRKWRWSQFKTLQIGQAMFIPDSFLSQDSNPAHTLQSYCSHVYKTTGRRYRAKKGEHKAQRGFWVIRES